MAISDDGTYDSDPYDDPTDTGGTTTTTTPSTTTAGDAALEAALAQVLGIPTSQIGSASFGDLWQKRGYKTVAELKPFVDAWNKIRPDDKASITGSKGDKVGYRGRTFDAVIGAGNGGGTGASWNDVTDGGSATATTSTASTEPRDIDPSFYAPWTKEFQTPTDATLPTYTKPQDFSYADYKSPDAFSYQDFAAPGDFSYQAYQGPGAYTPGQFQAPGAFVAPTSADAMNDPGYQFSRDEALKAQQTSAAAKGVLNSTGTLYDMAKTANGLASQQYGNVWNRAFQANQNQYSQARDTFGINEQAQSDAYRTNADQSLSAYSTNRANAADEWSKNYQKAMDAYTTNRGNQADIWQRNADQSLSGYTTNRANQADIWQRNADTGVTAFNADTNRAKSAYDQAWQQYQNDKDSFYTNQKNAYDRLFGLAGLGAGASA